MATRSPTQFHSFWGAYITALLPTSAEVEVGDTAFDSTLNQLVVCTAVGPVVWTPVGDGQGVTSVGGTAPISSSGGTTPTISISAATPLAAGSMSAADKAKLDGITAGAAVASVGATAPITSSGGTTPTIGLGTVGIANGGTGLTTVPANGQLLIGNGSGYTQAGLTAGSGVTITTGAGSITIAASGPVSAPVQVEIDFGSIPSWGAEFTIIAPTVSPASIVIVSESGATATGRVGNDQAWDQLSLAARAASGSFIVTAIPYPGPVVGKRKILYQVF